MVGPARWPASSWAAATWGRWQDPLADRASLMRDARYSLLQRGGIEEGLGCWSRPGGESLIDPVGTWRSKLKPPTRASDGTVLRVHGDQGGAERRGSGGEQQLFPFSRTQIWAPTLR